MLVFVEFIRIKVLEQTLEVLRISPWVGLRTAAEVIVRYPVQQILN